MAKEIYFAADDAEETSSTLLGKVDAWHNSLNSNGYLYKVRESWATYHGAKYGNISDGHKITFGGEQGELVNVSINHFRNIAQNMLVMTTTNRPSLEARSVNTDYKSLVQTQLANGLLDYYMREKRLEKYLHTAVEHAIVMGTGYIKVQWNTTGGEQVEFNEELNVPIYSGDIEYYNLSPFDVVFDPSKEHVDHDWILCRSFKNKYDLVAKYPEFEQEIMKVQTKDQLDQKFIKHFGYNDTDDIPIYEFFHERTESMPDGRYMLFVSPKAVVLDTPLPYREIPVYRISPSNILGTPFGYTTMFDLLPLQEGTDTLYSTILTNQNAFGVQNLYVPKGADISINNLAGGLNIIEGNPQYGKPEPLNLTQTPPEVFNFLQMLEQSMETISGVNSVTRGNPEASLKSGTALALVQSMTLQFMSGLQQEYVRLMEDIGTGLINTLKDFAKAPRIAMIAGKQNRAYMKEFTGDDLESINRVVVDVGNPLSKTTAGRVQMAEQMLQMGVIQNPHDFIQVMNTGNLDTMTEDSNREALLIRGENEKLAAGEAVIPIAIDEHVKHINEHKGVLSDPDLRNDVDLVERVLSHIQAHIELLRSTDPDLLATLNQQSLAPQMQAPPGAPMGQAPPGEMQAGPAVVPDQTGNMEMQAPGMEENVNLPNMPNPPPPFENMPTQAGDVVPE
jgi:hypothetical protein